MPLMYGIIAKQIVELAKAGERDPNLLREGAIDQKQTNGLTSRYVRLVPQADTMQRSKLYSYSITLSAQQNPVGE